MKKFILASASPRRKQLLEWAEIDFEIIVAHTEETYPADLSPKDIAIHIAVKKANAVKKLVNDGRTIIAADTIVVLDNEIIGKPKDREDAINILSKLNGKTHRVITGVAILNQQEQVFADVTEVEFNLLSKKEIEFYIDKYQPYDKAGSYGVQDWWGLVVVERIEGSYTNVMGLPTEKLYKALSNL